MSAETTMLARGDLSLAFDLTGKGPWLVCHPGGPGLSREHLGTLGGLDRTRTLVRLDPRGAGGSAVPSSGDYSLASFAADLEDLRVFLRIDKLDLFGHSHGAFVAARYAATYPVRVRRLILDAMALRTSEVRPPASGVAGYFARATPEARSYAEQLVTTRPDSMTWFTTHEVPSLDMSADLRVIPAPTLFIHGVSDWAVTEPAVREVRALMRDVTVVPIAGAGHFAWVEQPGDYRRALERFLA